MFGRSRRGSITAKIVPNHQAARRPVQQSSGRTWIRGARYDPIARRRGRTQTANEIKAALGDYASMSSGRARARGAAEGRHRTYDAIVLDRMLPGGNAVVRDGSSFAGLF
jgi:hypothetical protein